MSHYAVKNLHHPHWADPESGYRDRRPFCRDCGEPFDPYEIDDADLVAEDMRMADRCRPCVAEMMSPTDEVVEDAGS